MIASFVQEAYKDLIGQKTKFYDSSGLAISAGLDGFYFQAESLQSIFAGLTVSIESLKAVLQGGIALATPDEKETGPPIKDGQHFTLYDKGEKEWLDWSPDLILLDKEQVKQFTM